MGGQARSVRRARWGAGMMEPKEAAQRWVRRVNTPVGPTSGNFDLELACFLGEAPAEGLLEFLKLVAEHDLRDEAIEFLGAGPVEDFLHHRSANLGQLKELVAQNHLLQRALCCAICDEESPRASFEFWAAHTCSSEE